MQFATLHQDRLLSLAVCTSPVTFDAHHTETADMIDREGVAAWVEHTIGRRLDPQLVAPAYIRWYAAQMAATPAHVVSEFQRRAPGGDLRPLLPSVKTPTLVLAAARLARGGAGGLPKRGRPVSQRTVSGVPRRQRLCPARPAGALRPGLAGLCC